MASVRVLAPGGRQVMLEELWGSSGGGQHSMEDPKKDATGVDVHKKGDLSIVARFLYMDAVQRCPMAKQTC